MHLYNWQRIAGFSVLHSSGEEFCKYVEPCKTLRKAVNWFNKDTYIKSDKYVIVTQIQLDGIWIAERYGDGKVYFNKDKLKELWDKEFESL